MKHLKTILPVVIISLTIGYASASLSTAEQPDRSPINLTHALSLVDSIEINGELLTYVTIYADAPDYKPVNATGEGITCVDDVGRFLEILETEILSYNNRGLLNIAEGMTRFLLYLSRDDGLWYNFMFADGRINTTHQNSEAEFGWWAIRGLRGLAAAYNIFSTVTTNDSLLEKIVSRLEVADGHIREVIQHYPDQKWTSLGMKPGWLVKDAPDMNGELLLTLSKLHSAGDFNYYETIEKISQGIIGYQYREPEHDLDGMYFCWKNRWHNWGNNQAYALLEAYKIIGDSTILASVTSWADSFIPFLVKNKFPWEITVNANKEYNLTAMPQIAYGMNSIYHGLKTLAGVTSSKEYLELAEEVFQWYQGRNIAQMKMYDPVTGRCFDGINNAGSVNLNSGAESTIECLSAILLRGSFQE